MKTLSKTLLSVLFSVASVQAHGAIKAPKAHFFNPTQKVEKACVISSWERGHRSDLYFLYSKEDKTCEIAQFATTLAGVEYSGRSNTQMSWEECFEQFKTEAVDKYGASDALEGVKASSYQEANMTWDNGILGCQ